MDLTAPPVSLVDERLHYKPTSAVAPAVPVVHRLAEIRKPVAIGVMIVFLILGIFLRVHPTATFSRLGYDEYRYILFLKQTQQTGIANYAAVVRAYVDDQYKRPDAVVPATRVGFLAPVYFCLEVLKQKPFDALRNVAALASIALLAVATIWAYRLGGLVPMVGTSVLVATAPLQIQLAQHTFIDAYFCFWAIASFWLAWENLQRPRRWFWLAAYALSLLMLVLSKESAVFVVAALLGIFAVNCFLRFGVVTPHLLAATVIGPAIAVVFLVMLVGGLPEWIHFWQMFSAKSRTNWYSVVAQDGPWYRYLVDFVLISPLVAVLALGRMFNLRKGDRAEVLMAIFLGFSFVCMAKITNGVSLRYAAYWDIPLAWLAASQIFRLARQFPKIRPSILGFGLLSVVAVCGLRQYDRFFVQGGVYDPITSQLIQAADFEKPVPKGH